MFNFIKHLYKKYNIKQTQKNIHNVGSRKKVLFLVVRPLRGGGVVRARPIRKKERLKNFLKL